MSETTLKPGDSVKVGRRKGTVADGSALITLEEQGPKAPASLHGYRCNSDNPCKNSSGRIWSLYVTIRNAETVVPSGHEPEPVVLLCPGCQTPMARKDKV